MLRRTLLGLAIALVLAFGAFFAWQWRGELPPASTSTSAHAFDPGIVAKGAQLARIGECAACHTRVGGKPYAGGFPVQTPFGVVFGSFFSFVCVSGFGAWSVVA